MAQAKQKRRRYLYVAYSLSLTLKAANAVQTFQTMRALRGLAASEGDEIVLVVPRWLREESRFAAEFGPAVVHLPRIALNKLTRFWKSSVFSYAERSAFSVELLLWLLWRRLTGRGFAAIYARDVVCAYWLLRGRALAGAPVIYEAHDLEQTNPSRARGDLWRGWLRELDRVVLTRSARVVSLTEEFRRWLAARNIRRPAEVTVIPDAFDDSSYSGLDQAEARRQLGLPPDAFVAGYAGLTFAYRRLDLLIDAFAWATAAAPPQPPAILALIGGRPAEVAEFGAQARRLGLPVSDRPGGENRQVILTGQLAQEQVVPWLYAADTLVIPDTVSSLTASPLKLFEYMAAGRPIILRELPALREILDDDSAIFFPPGDGAALAAALKRLRADPVLREKLGSAARSRSARYTYRQRARQVLDVMRNTV